MTLIIVLICICVLAILGCIFLFICLLGTVVGMEEKMFGKIRYSHIVREENETVD